MNEPHLFRCEPCRADRRLRRAWKKLPPLADLEAQAPVDEAFVERVLTAVRTDRRQSAVRLVGLAAAAALLFFFFAGAGGQRASSAVTSVEQEYAQLDLPSALDELLPD
jgi:ferric-dicitrate binding protein FerR (iron transport regulator)